MSRRVKVPRRASNSLYRRSTGAANTHPKNLAAAPMRGGIRL